MGEGRRGLATLLEGCDGRQASLAEVRNQPLAAVDLVVAPGPRREIRLAGTKPVREELGEGQPADVEGPLAHSGDGLLAVSGGGALARKAPPGRGPSARVAIGVAPAQAGRRLVRVDVRCRAARPRTAGDALLEGERLGLGCEAPRALLAVLAPAHNPGAPVAVHAHRRGPRLWCSHRCSHVVSNVFPRSQRRGRHQHHEREKPRVSRAFSVRPGRLELPPRMNRTRPSTLRVYQFRHRRVER